MLQGTPILKRIQNDCHYEFEWPTNIICRNHIGQFHEEKCEIYNSQLNTTFDLRNLFKDGLVEVINYDGKALELNVCKNNTRIEIDYSQSTINSFFDAKAPCKKNGNHINFFYFEIRFIWCCNTSKNHWLYVFVYDINALNVFFSFSVLSVVYDGHSTHYNVNVIFDKTAYGNV